jgi:hypothetical protein
MMFVIGMRGRLCKFVSKTPRERRSGYDCQRSRSGLALVARLRSFATSAIELGQIMQLKIQRSQRAGGVMGNTVFFCLDVRADYSPEERSNIQKYKLGGQMIYNSQAARKHLERAGAHLDRTQAGSVGERASGLARGALSMAMAKMSLNISIASLGRGHHIECKDLEELLEAEDTVRNSCKNVTRYLDAAATFDGSETVVEYDKGEEKVHVTQAAPPLLTYAPSESSPTESSSGDTGEGAEAYRSPAYDFGAEVRKFWADPQYRKFTYWAAVGLGLMLFLRSCL